MAKQDEEKRNPFEGGSYAARLRRRAEQETVEEIDFPETGTPAHQQTSTPAQQYAGTTVDQSTGEAVDQRDSTPADQPTSEPVKVTLYLPEEADAALHELWTRLRQEVGRKDERKITKGDIVAAALDIAAKQWEDPEALHRLAGALVHQYTSRNRKT